MKKIFTIVVTEEEGVKLEGLFNKFQIEMNDWEGSKIFEVQGFKLRTYTVVCDEETFNDITELMNGQRVY